MIGLRPAPSLVRIRARLTLWLGLALLTGSSARAQQTIELQTVLSSVAEHHPLLAAQRESERAARGEVLAADGGFDTTLRVQGRSALAGYYDPQRVDVVLEQPTALLGASAYAGYRITAGTVPSYYGELRTLDAGEARAGLRVPLLQDRAIDARRAAVQAAKARQEAASLAVSELLLQLERASAQSYYAWLAAGRRMRVLRDLLALAQLRDVQLEQKVELGAIAAIDRLDNQRAIFERQRQLVGAERALEKSALELSLYLRDAQGRPRVPSEAELPQAALDEDVAAMQDEQGEQAPAPAQAQAQAQAFTQRPELARAAALVQAARVERELADNQVAPRLDVFGEVSRDFGASDAQRTAELAPTVVEVGASFVLPLQQRTARGKRDAATAKEAAAEHTRQLAHERVRVEVADALSALRAATERVQIARDGADVARQVADGERERFERGASTILFVNLREQAAADAALAFIDAQLELSATRAWVRTALGERLLSR